MIEKALLTHLRAQPELSAYLATYAGYPAVFHQEAPADKDPKWGAGPQYGRIVFIEDMQGDPERIMGGTLIVDILCYEDKQFPEVIEPLIRRFIHGYFFANGTFVAAAQWRNSSLFKQPEDKITGCTVTFELLAFPVLTTDAPDIITRLNEWSGGFEGLHVINHDTLPDTAWKPTGTESAVYWRLVSEAPAGWIPDNYHTIWRTAIVRGHIFSENISVATTVGQRLTTGLYAVKRLKKSGEAPVMVNTRNTFDEGADALRTGQMTVEATYGVIVRQPGDGVINNIHH